VTVVTVTAVAHCRNVQFSTGLTFRGGPAGSTEGAARRTTGDCKRLECSSGVSGSMLSDTAHSQAEQADRQHSLLTVRRYCLTVNTNLIVVSANYINKVNMLQPIMLLFWPDSITDSINATTALNTC
jgi:hypothetical protein